MIRSPKPAVLLAFAAIYLIWGSTYLAIKVALTTIPPFTMTAARSLTAGAVLYAWGRWRGADPPTGLQWLASASVGGMLFLVGHGGLGWAQQRVPSGVASLFIATIPLWMTLIEAVTDRAGELTARTVVGITAGMAGVLLLVGPGPLLGGEQVDPLGAVVLVLSALAWSVGSALARKVPRPSSLTVTTGTYLLSGGAMLYIAGLAAGEATTFNLAAVSMQSLAALSYLIVLGSVVAFGAYSWLLRRRSLATVSTYAFVNPIAAVLLGWTLGGESLNGRILAAAALVISAVGIILTRRSSGTARSTPRPRSPRPTQILTEPLRTREPA